MLTGGFYSVDAELLCRDPGEEKFLLPFDPCGRYSHIQLTNNGRTATIYALKQALGRLRGRKVLLPDYLCVSVLTALDQAGVHYAFYRVTESLAVDLDDLQEKAERNAGMIYLIHYFGVPQPAAVAEEVRRLAAEKGLLIFEDMTQALYSFHPGRLGYGDFAAGSVRKWFPMTDGGVAAVREGCDVVEIPLADPYDEAAYRELLISVVREYFDRHPHADREAYLQFEREANASRYKELSIRGMTEASARILANSDKEKLVRRRRENYRFLYDALQNCSAFQVFGAEVAHNDAYTPFGFVILTEDRDQLYDYLVRRDIVPEIQWRLPTDRYAPGAAARWFSERNLMIQCDQRYGTADMERVAEALLRYRVFGKNF